MASKHLRGDVNFAWPSAEIAVMGPKGAVEIIFRSQMDDPEKDRRAEQRTIAKNSPTRLSLASLALSMMSSCRKIPVSGSVARLSMLKDKDLKNPWRKHGNIPL